LNLSQLVKDAIDGAEENERIEFKAVLPPSRKLAQLISSFANSDGGLIVLGVQETPEGLVPNGLSKDFHVSTIIYKALDYLSHRPQVDYEYVKYAGKTLYAISIEKSDQQIQFENKVYVRKLDQIVTLNQEKESYKANGYSRIKEINKLLEEERKSVTQAKENVTEHYLSVLKLLDDLGNLIYPENPKEPSTKPEGLVLSRIIFSSVVDNFETYLSDLLYEIYLAVPMSLKSKETITIEEVLECSDMQEFVSYCAKKRIGKLQKGSVKGFIKDNKQIDNLGVFDKSTIIRLDEVLQIRHLYSHRNGIVDEKFLQFHPDKYDINSLHKMSIDEICDVFIYLINIIEKVDEAARTKYKLGQ
jgi:hypothetical protein